MGSISRFIILLSLLLVSRAIGEIDTFTLEEVESQISDFIQNTHNGTTFNQRDYLQPSLPTRCTLACTFLNHSLPGRIAYPESSTYQYEESRYWSEQQASVSPFCRFSPESAFEVSLAVLTVQVAQCQFAVKSGGHAAFAGASNINGGVTIDLINLNQMDVSQDGTETSVGPGNTWYDVYSKLEVLGLSVIGGRVSAIGVGGFTLGGGISFFSGRYGWGCDNVNTYEVVFADGSIREVSYSNYPDLYFALRGGGNNFGIVTRFDLVTFPQGDLWAGSQTFIYNNDTAAALNEAFYYLNINAPSDPYGQVILAYAYVQSLDTYIIASDLQYGKPVVNPPILQNFTAVPGAVASTLSIRNLTSLTQEFNNSNPGGFRESYYTLMVKNSPTILTEIIAIFMEEMEPVQNATDIIPSIVLQPVTTDTISHFSKDGGNALGISLADGPLDLISTSISWSSVADDARILAASRNFISRANATAYAQGLGNRFLYQNYAGQEQDVFAGYGQENLERLREVGRKYDPSGVWQKLQPGYFKLG